VEDARWCPKRTSGVPLHRCQRDIRHRACTVGGSARAQVLSALLRLIIHHCTARRAIHRTTCSRSCHLLSQRPLVALELPWHPRPAVRSFPRAPGRRRFPVATSTLDRPLLLRRSPLPFVSWPPSDASPVPSPRSFSFAFSILIGSPLLRPVVAGQSRS